MINSFITAWWMNLSRLVMYAEWVDGKGSFGSCSSMSPPPPPWTPHFYLSSLINTSLCRTETEKAIFLNYKPILTFSSDQSVDSAVDSKLLCGRVPERRVNGPSFHDECDWSCPSGCWERQTSCWIIHHRKQQMSFKEPKCHKTDTQPLLWWMRYDPQVWALLLAVQQGTWL